MPSRLSSTLLFAILSLAGCTIPDAPNADQSLTQALPESTSVRETFAADTGGSDRAMPSDWIAAFGDPRLEELIDEALANNLNLRAAASQVESASGLVRQAGAELQPVVTAALENTETGLEGGQTTTRSQGALNVSWELDIWGRIRAQTAAQEADFRATVAEYEFARLSLKAAVARAWFRAIETRLQLDFANETIGLKQKTLDIVETKREFGDLGMQDVHLARADLASSRERQRQARAAYELALRGLELLLGRYPSAEMEVGVDLVAVPPPVPPGLPSDLLERRPDLVAAQERVAASFNLITSAKAARLPSIALTGSAGGTSDGLSSLLTSGGGFWSIGGNFLAPIFDGGRREAQVEIATANQEAALAQFGQAALTAFSEVETALSNEVLLSEREELLREVVRDSQSAYDIAEVRYREGEIELLGVLDVQDRLINTQIALISIRNARLSERIDLHLTLGGDFRSDDGSLTLSDY